VGGKTKIINWIESAYAQTLFMHANVTAAILCGMIAWFYNLNFLYSCIPLNLVCAWIASENAKFYRIRERK